MVAWTYLRRFTAVAIGSGAGLVAYKYLQSPHVAEAAWSTSTKPVSPCALWDSNWDCREPKSLVRPPKNDSPEEENRYNSDLEQAHSMAVRHIILMRHGDYKKSGGHLTERGSMQVNFTAKRLEALGIEWDRVIASTMTRAQETMKIVVEQINFDQQMVEHCELIKEGAPIVPEPLGLYWKPGPDLFCDGARIEAGFRRYFHRAPPEQLLDSYTLIIGHANVIRYFVCRALQLPPEAWSRINLDHASITWLTINPNGTVDIKCMGDSGFIPNEHLTNRIPEKS